MKKLLLGISVMICISVFAQSQKQASTPKNTSPSSKQEITGWERQAEKTTIIRDTWGVPHVYGKTNADVVFGLTYARAEDEFNKMEDAYIEAIGRLAEVKGISGLENDFLIHAFETVAVAKQELKTSSNAVRQMAISWANALNYYLYRHPDVKPKLINRFEPWFLFAESIPCLSSS